MNRTLLPQASSQLLRSSGTENWFGDQAVFSVEERQATTATSSCFLPIHYEAGYSYPLIVWLHGPLSNEDELKRVMPLVSLRNHLGIAPRGTRKVEGVSGAYCWGDSSEDIAEAGERVRHCIEIAQERYNVHSERVYVAGHSTGGTMAHRLGMEFPHLFAGAISLGGPVPRGSRPLKNINAARKLPFLLSVSPTDQKYETSQVMDDLRFLHCAGFSLSLRMYPEGDELTTVMFSDMDKWVMEQFCSTNTVATS